MNETIAISLFGLAIAVNAASVFVQRRYKLHEKLFSNHAYLAHRILINVFWLAAIAGVIWAATQTAPNPNIPVHRFGETLSWLGILGFIFSLKEIGFAGMQNRDQFTGERKELKGIYYYVHDPMYMSFTFILLGVALSTGIYAFYAFAFLSLIGLQGILAAIENGPVKLKE